MTGHADDPRAEPTRDAAVDPTAVHPTALDPTAVDPTAVHPTAVDPTAVHPSAARAVEDIARGSYGRLVAYLASVSGDIAAAEDALSEAFVAALRTWPERGVPDRPDSWLVTAARRTLVDAARRRSVAQRGLRQIAALMDREELPGNGHLSTSGADASSGSAVPDKRLELMFACTHPAIGPAMRAPLMLQAVLGIDAARIGAAFLVPPATMGQRLVRAKTKIKVAGVPFTVPDADELPGRVSSVLDAVFAAYGTGWDELGEVDRSPEGSRAVDSRAVDSRAVDSSAPDINARDAGRADAYGGAPTALVPEAIRLAGLIAELLPDSGEAHGLLALLLHSNARATARRSVEGAFVPLDRQDVTLWSRSDIAAAESHLSRALALNRSARQLGPYQLQAAIQSVHNRRAITGRTDWAAITSLYDGLVSLTPTVGACVARASAVAHLHGPVAAIALLEDLPPELVRRYQPYWVVMAHCRSLRGDGAGAMVAADIAIALTSDAAVATYLRAQYRPPSADDGSVDVGDD